MAVQAGSREAEIVGGTAPVREAGDLATVIALPLPMPRRHAAFEVSLHPNLAATCGADPSFAAVPGGAVLVRLTLRRGGDTPIPRRIIANLAATARAAATVAGVNAAARVAATARAAAAAAIAAAAGVAAPAGVAAGYPEARKAFY